MSSEKEPSLTLRIGEDKTMEMTPSNATLYTFLGRTSIGDMEIDNSSVNHVFVRTSPDGAPQATGMYFFREFSQENYDVMATHMTEHRYPMILNMITVPECDLRAWLDKTETIVGEFASQIPDSPEE